MQTPQPQLPDHLHIPGRRRDVPRDREHTETTNDTGVNVVCPIRATSVFRELLVYADFAALGMHCLLELKLQAFCIRGPAFANLARASPVAQSVTAEAHNACRPRNLPVELSSTPATGDPINSPQAQMKKTIPIRAPMTSRVGDRETTVIGGRLTNELKMRHQLNTCS